MAGQENAKRRNQSSISNYGQSLPVDVQIVVPALLQLNRGTGAQHHKSTTREARPTATSTEGCFDLHCASCWTDCASYCPSPCDEGDDCPMAQLCYDEHCSPAACADDGCPSEACDDVTCKDAVLCDTTCFDDSCIWPNSSTRHFDPQLCAQANCFGSLPCSSGFQDFSKCHDIHDREQQYAGEINDIWSQPSYQGTSHNHVNPSNHHKRQKTDCSESDRSDHGPRDFMTLTASQSWQPHVNEEYGSTGLSCQTSDIQPAGFVYDNWIPAQFDVLGTTTTPSFTQTMTQNDVFANTVTDVGTANVLDGLICGLSHFSATAQGVDSSTINHSPFCGLANNKRSRPKQAFRPEQQGIYPTLSTLPALPTESINKSPPPPSHLFSPVFDEFKSKIDEERADRTCKWMVGHTSCGQSFASSKELDHHMQEQHTNKLGPHHFVCQWIGCSTTFKHRGKLNRHIAGAHSRYHAYSCSHCDKTFCTKEQLKNHETTHTGERRYKCRFCEHTSATKTQHNTHERTHTKEKPFACPFCPHRSGDSSNLSKHVKNKHTNLPASRPRGVKAMT